MELALPYSLMAPSRFPTRPIFLKVTILPKCMYLMYIVVFLFSTWMSGGPESLNKLDTDVKKGVLWPAANQYGRPTTLNMTWLGTFHLLRQSAVCLPFFMWLSKMDLIVKTSALLSGNDKNQLFVYNPYMLAFLSKALMLFVDVWSANVWAQEK